MLAITSLPAHQLIPITYLILAIGSCWSCAPGSQPKTLQNKRIEHTQTDNFEQALAVFKGERLYLNYCAHCHLTDMRRDITGPGLGAVLLKKNRNWIKRFTHSSQQMIDSGDPYAVELFNTWHKTRMNDFLFLDSADLEHLVLYIENQAQAQGFDPTKFKSKEEVPYTINYDSIAALHQHEKWTESEHFPHKLAEILLDKKLGWSYVQGLDRVKKRRKSPIFIKVKNKYSEYNAGAIKIIIPAYQTTFSPNWDNEKEAYSSHSTPIPTSGKAYIMAYHYNHKKEYFFALKEINLGDKIELYTVELEQKTEEEILQTLKSTF